LPVWCCALVTFALTPVWYRFTSPLIPPYDITRHALFAACALTLLVWLLTGAAGLGRLLRHPSRAVWVSASLGLCVWAYASSAWSYTAPFRPEVSLNVALGLVVGVGFALAVASTGLPARAVLLTLAFGVGWNALLGGQQVALQGSAGGVWKMLNEFTLVVERSGTSVVMADGVRWLRPYGLLPHPNLLAGALGIGLLASAPLLTRRIGVLWLGSLGVWLGGAWVFLLTFSRGGYFAVGVGGLLLLILFWRHGGWRKSLGVAALCAALTGAAFVALYHPFLLARAGVATENTELYSLGERAMLTAVASDLIRAQPWSGAGAGGAPWVAAQHLYDINSPILGNYPHTAALALWADLGVIGLALWLMMVGGGVVASFALLRQRPPDALARAALLAAFVAWFATGLTEYAPATLLHSQALGWGILAAALAPANRRMLESGASAAQ
jgi:O-antigen ligase